MGLSLGFRELNDKGVNEFMNEQPRAFIEREKAQFIIEYHAIAYSVIFSIRDYMFF